MSRSAFLDGVWQDRDSVPPQLSFEQTIAKALERAIAWHNQHPWKKSSIAKNGQRWRAHQRLLEEAAALWKARRSA